MNITRKLAVASCLSMLPLTSAWSWDGDIHYHLSYYLAHLTGFDSAQASIIAGAAQYVDYYPLTDPVAKADVSGVAQEQRRFFHFPKWDYYSTPDTTRDDFFGRYNIQKALQDAGSSDAAVKALSPYRFGMAVHVLADTYSHEGYGFLRGHAFSGGDWHNPDRPYHNYVNIEKTVEVARLILGDMQTFYRAFKEGDPKKTDWEKIEAFVRKAAVKCVGSYKEDYEEEIAQRSACWEKYFKEQNLEFIAYKGSDWESGARNQQFVGAFYQYCLPHKAPTQTDDAAAESGPTRAISTRQRTAQFTVTGSTFPSPDQYCAILDQNTGNNPLKVADFLLDAPWMIQAGCVREAAANPVVLAAFLDAVAESGLDAVYPVSALFEHSTATPEVKNAVLRESLSSASLDERLFAADKLMNDPESHEIAQKTLFDAWNAAPDAITRERVFAYIPEHIDFLPIFSDVLTDGSPLQQTQAAHVLFQLPEPEARAVLRREAWRILNTDQTASDLAYWLVMGLDASPTPLDILSTYINQYQLMQLLQNSQAENIVKPAVYALRSYYPTASPPYRERIARALIAALRVEDIALRWHVGYSLVYISGVDFDLSPDGLKTIQIAAEAWYHREFHHSVSE